MTRRVLLALAALTLSPVHAGGGGAPVGTAPQPACRDGYMRPDLAALTRDLAAARARWSATGLRDYTYDLRQIAAPVLFPDTRVTVRAGRAVGTTILPGQEGTPNPLARQTMEQRLDDIARTLAFQRGRTCPEVRVTFDAQTGHPTYLYSGLGDAGIADGFGEWTVTTFTPTR